jgi:repressor LexA
MTSLTRKQQEILDFLIDNQEAFSHPPTLDELCHAMGLKSRGSMHYQIKALIEAGLIQSPERKQRGIRLTQQASVTSSNEANNQLPYAGVIAAGRPIEAIETISFMHIPEQIRTDNPCYVLKVKGDSMQEEGILDGDWVIIEKRNHARNGEIVVALVENSEATLKFIQQKPNEILLIPANSSMQTMRYLPHQVQIQGVLVGQMRSYTHH